MKMYALSIPSGQQATQSSKFNKTIVTSSELFQVGISSKGNAILAEIRDQLITHFCLVYAKHGDFS